MAERDDAWIEWNGGECPVGPKVQVEILFRCERENPDDYVEGNLPADDVDWTHGKRKSDFDVVAYRVVKP